MNALAWSPTLREVPMSRRRTTSAKCECCNETFHVDTLRSYLGRRVCRMCAKNNVPTLETFAVFDRDCETKVGPK